MQSVFGNETSVFGYDLSGKSLFWKNVNAVHTNATTYNYNSRGWVTSERQTIEGRTNIISYFYNSIGGLTNEIYPSGTNVTRTYDGLHRLTAITAGTASVRYNYLKNDLIDSMRYGNGLIQAFMYDKRDRVTSFWISNTGMAPVLKQNYTYDASGNRTNFTDERGYSVNYAYDELDRLAKIIYPESVGDASYFYDNTGNRFEYYYPYGHHSYTYNNLNELTRMTVNRNGSVEFSYDRNGNQTSEIHKAGNDKVKEIRYNWGVNDRLDRMEFPQLKPDSYGTKVLDFVYTPAGNRVRKTYKDNIRTYTDRLYIYNGAGTLVEEFDIKSNRLETIHAGNIRIKDNLVEYDFRDMLSSTVLISDAAGKVLQRYRYDPFGEIEQAKGNSDNRFLFNGKEADESGLSFYGARYYNSITGRWISRDPLAGNIYQPQSLNRYQFCKNNPLRYIDPDGKEAIEDFVNLFKSGQIYDNVNSGMDPRLAALNEQTKDASIEIYKITYEVGEKAVVTAGVMAGGYMFYALEAPAAILSGARVANDIAATVWAKAGAGFTILMLRTCGPNAASTGSKDIVNVEKTITELVGKDAKRYTSPSGDLIIQGKEFRIRFNVENPHGYDPHFHIEKIINGIWKDAVKDHMFFFKKD